MVLSQVDFLPEIKKAAVKWRSLYACSSYRQFLAEAFGLEKESTRSVTLASYAEKFGIAASSFKMILSGQRNLTVENLNCIARVLKMSFGEREYFEAMIHHEQSSDAETKKYYRQKMRVLKKQSSVHTIRVAERGLIADSITPSLLIYLWDIERIGEKHTSLDQLPISRIARDLKVSEEIVRMRIQELISSGILSQETGKPVHFFFDRLATQIGEKNYILNEVEVLKKQIHDRFSDPDTMFRAFTLTISRDDLPSLRHDVIALLERYMAKLTSDPEKSVIEKVIVGAYPVW